jgi:hypothetical protein
MQAAETTNALAIERLHDRTKVDRNILIALSSLELVGFVKRGLEADWTVIDLGDVRQVG